MTVFTREMWLRAGRITLACALALAGCAGAVGSGADESVEGSEADLGLVPKAPAELAVPKDNFLAFKLKGDGQQVYACGATGWVLDHPDADLLLLGHVVGSHYKGPTWEALDGSTVVGTKLAGVTVDATAVPWLLLQGTSHTGKGAMSKVSYVQRLNTKAGLAPTTGCSAETVGAISAIDYTADYYFYLPVPKPAAK